MKLVLDSTIFCQDYWLASTSFRVLKEGLQLVPADLRVPQVVVEEVVNRYREDLETALAEAKRKEARVRRLLSEPVETGLGSLNPAKEAQAYREWLVSALEQFGGQILPYPEVSHEKVVQRDLQRKKPFKRNGAGYRDFLIWESIRYLMVLGIDRVVFVTGNTTDFGEGPLAAPDLQETIRDPSRLELVNGLITFNEKFIVPRLAVVKGLSAQLQTDAGITFDLGRWLKASLLGLLWDEDWGPIVAGLPDGLGLIHPTEVVAFTVMDVEDVRKLSENERLVRLRVEADIAFSISVRWEDYVRHAEVRELVGDDGEAFSSASWSQAESVTVGLNLILGAKGEKVITEDITLIEGPYASIEISP